MEKGNSKDKHYKAYLKALRKLKKLSRRDDKAAYDKLWNEIWNNPDFRQFQPYFGKSFPRSKGRTKKRDDIRKFMNGDKDDLFNEKIPKDYEY